MNFRDVGENPMPITIHPDLEARLRARAEAAGVIVETYIERIACDDQAAEDELEALALEGLKSGESIGADEQYWADKRQRLIDRHLKTGTRR
jgi:hypothetical protein